MYSKMLTTRHNTFIVPGSYTCIPSGYLYSPWIFVFLLSVGFFLAAFVYTFRAFSVLPWIYFSCLGSYKIPLVWQLLSVRKCVKLVFKGEQIAKHLRTEATNSSWFQAEQSNNLSGNSTSNYLWSRTCSKLFAYKSIKHIHPTLQLTFQIVSEIYQYYYCQDPWNSVL